MLLDQLKQFLLFNKNGQINRKILKICIILSIAIIIMLDFTKY